MTNYKNERKNFRNQYNLLVNNLYWQVLPSIRDVMFILEELDPQIIYYPNKPITTQIVNTSWTSFFNLLCMKDTLQLLL